MEKVSLQSLFTEKLKTFEECFTDLGWKYEIIDNGKGAQNITCCGEKVSCGGWFGTEHLSCKKCHKGMQDVTGLLPTEDLKKGIGFCQFIDWDKTELPTDGRVWVSKNVWGF